eukprot:TRINITY_DN12224_c0_g1_i2.p1 TRINITY_DN12224_c0_g1~~TRINITY_DN12224_c0_g1_i2.p1  ORF type:complete len:284 (-),score=51.22 TRINITY_DN12224_c0_g1_i2:23-874(-)
MDGWKMELESLKLIKNSNFDKIEGFEQYQIQLPNVLYSGMLYDEDDPWLTKEDFRRWRWPYCIQNYIPGRPIHDLYPSMDPPARHTSARFLGKILRRIHSLDIRQHALSPPQPWHLFSQFLEYERRHFLEKQKDLKAFDPKLLESIEKDYLPKFGSQLFSSSEPPVFLHADVTDENLIGRLEGKTWHPIGVLDFGDSRLGDPLYDLIPIHIDIFKCDKALTMSLMESYGLEYWKGQSRFAYRAMCYTIMHEQPAVLGVFRSHPEWKQIQDIKELEKLVWDFGF